MILSLSQLLLVCFVLFVCIKSFDLSHKNVKQNKKIFECGSVLSVAELFLLFELLFSVERAKVPNIAVAVLWM